MAYENMEKPCVKLNEQDVKFMGRDYRMKKNLTSLKNTKSVEKLFDDGLFWNTFISTPLDSATFQDFYEIRSRCLAEGRLFEDPEFPPINDPKVVWQRPTALCNDPKLFVEGFSRFDVQQGILGDCWLLAAMANLTENRKLFLQVVPEDQSFNKGEYAGVFHFRFWHYGRWVDLVIDDRLPTYKFSGELLFGHSPDKNEFWCALLEKAYAKLYGSYAALVGGETSTALVDFTGGVPESYEIAALPPNFFKTLLKAYERNSLLGCYIAADQYVDEAKTPYGLVKGHAYSITKVQYLTVESYNIDFKNEMLRLRNPWGNEWEWNGAWSDKSKEWNSIPQSEKEKMGLNFENDGEFWISYQDFCQHFTGVEICNLDPKSLDPDSNTKTWEMSLCEGKWIHGVNAGGCRNYLESFWLNPQYQITLIDLDEDDGEDKCTIIVALMQKHRRSLPKLHIGFAVYRLPENEQVPEPLNEMFFRHYNSLGKTVFINSREVTARLKLYPGKYVIVPSTFYPNEEGEFILRVFSETSNNMTEYGSKFSTTYVYESVGK